MTHCKSMSRAAVTALLLTGALVAQWPGHTALLNYTPDVNQMQIVHTGDVIHAVGVTAGLAPHFVHYARSRDGGRSFPIHDQPLAYIGGATPLLGGLMGGLTVDGDLVAAAVCVPWGGPYLLRSADGGDSWAPPVRISTQSSVPFVTRVHAHAHGANVAVVWTESRTAGNTWANFSADGGATWLGTDLQLDVGTQPGGNHSVLATAVGDEIHVVINRQGTPYLAYYQRSTDGGAT